MKTKIIFLLLLLSSVSKAQTHLWTKQVAGKVNSYYVTSDAAGNVFTAGYFVDTVDFNPGSGINKLSTTGASGYVSKLDATGNFLWVANVKSASAGVNYSNSRIDLTTDISGNVYVSGFFAGTCDFDPGSATYTLTEIIRPSTVTPSHYPGNNFIWKLTANGNFAWAKQIPTGIVISSCKTDLSGNLYVAGNFSGTQDFNWGPGISNYTSIGTMDCFLAKLDPTGNLINVKQFGYSGQSNSIKDISVDAFSNIYLIGTFTGLIDADPGPANTILNVNGSSYQYFNIKLDQAGNFINATAIPGHSANTSMYDVSNDKLGNIYVAGQYTGIYDFDPSPASHTLQATSNSAFICKLNSSANFLWVKTIDLQQGNFFRTFHDGGGNIFFAGELTSGVVDCDPGPGTYTLAPGSFISILNSAGNFVSAVALTNLETPNNFHADNIGSIYISNGFIGNCSTSKYSSVFTGIKSQIKDQIQATLFPNPGDGDFILKTPLSSQIYSLEIYNTLGQKLQEQIIDSELTSLDLKNYERGIYFLRLSNKSINVWQTKLIKE